MSDASVEVLLDDFENKDNWDVAGAGAARTHMTTFAEGAPSKEPGVYANGAAGADYRAVALLIRSATDDFEFTLIPKPGKSFPIPGHLEALNLWVRSPHASIQIFGRIGGTGPEERELLLGKVTAGAEWQRVAHDLSDPVVGADVIELKIQLTQVVKRAGEVMILLDDLTARTRP
ncbi:hypothetical protein [Nocardia sp. NPDC050710]|uniref:hypothetical protein n=1 Tax=Nocardia sp. NPDC050710 TaxID=3157220 RepID=UPI0033E02103